MTAFLNAPNEPSKSHIGSRIVAASGCVPELCVALAGAYLTSSDPARRDELAADVVAYGCQTELCGAIVGSYSAELDPALRTALGGHSPFDPE